MSEDLYGDMANEEEDLYGDMSGGGTESEATAATTAATSSSSTDPTTQNTEAQPVEEEEEESDSDDEIQITITGSSNSSRNQQNKGVRLRRNVWAEGEAGTNGAPVDQTSGGASATTSASSSSSASSNSAAAAGESDLMREENPYAVKLDPDSYPDDAPLATADGKVFRFNQHRRHTAYDMDMNEIRGKNWVKEGQDLSDYFNYGMDEAEWTTYAKKQCKKRNKLNFLMYLEEQKVKRPTPEDIEKMKTTPYTKRNVATTSNVSGGNGGSGGSGGNRPTGRVAVSGNQGGGRQYGNGSMATSERSCYKCGNSGHIAKDCPEVGEDIRACHTCGKTGHLSANCPEQRCYVCNGIGHISKACPNRGQQQQQQQRNGYNGRNFATQNGRSRGPPQVPPQNGSGGYRGRSRSRERR